jgi:eukaryotic-like serine/threonine-protein kinase
LIDLHSSNGTYVNGKRVTETFLKDGDVISGGTTKIRVSVRGDEPTATLKAGTAVSSCSSTVNLPQSPSNDNKQDAPADGCKLNGYELKEKLGIGSMGVVYRAMHVTTFQEVAVKLIQPAQSASERAVQLFIREANVLGRLNHRHIVRCFDFGFEAAQLYLVMEYVPTVRLRSVVAGRSRSTQIRIACGIIVQVLKALQHAHELSIVHRDIKPANLLLSRKGGTLNVKLADFGLAKNYEYAGLSQLSSAGDIRGTVAYMPPEIIVDCRGARPISDIYSVGATLYYFLTGKFPFDFADRNKLLVVLEEEPVPVQQRSADIPSKLAKIVHRAIEKDPTKRFPNAESMREALQPFATRPR